ncbi:peroxidase [Striga asiatica]|uniref:peroxidase n=1 Tax=Striga asiatica TaxID=4170 RepID=A0A5A7QAQ5_STRAF|nr:peroxidase [Striga asiatica]
MSYKLLKTLVSIFVLSIHTFEPSEAQLKANFYRSSCAFAEVDVRKAVAQAIMKDQGIAVGLIRLHFHDCFVRGCDASVLIDSTPSNNAEKSAPLNNPSIRGFKVIDNAKNVLQSMCKGIFSTISHIISKLRHQKEN